MSESELGAVVMLFDKQIHGEGLERLRLILYPLLPWAELKMLTTPSDMYIKLVSLDTFSSSHGRALNIFLFALKAIGGSVRGKYCANEARRLLNHQSTLDFSGESRKFRFFYWLLKIVRRLPPACKEDILLHFGRSLNTNHRHYEGSLPSLFIELHQGGKVSEDDTSELGDTLKTCKNRFEEGTPEFTAVQKCISYLTNFNFNTGEEEEPFTSADEESTAASMHESHHEDKPSDVIGRKHSKKQRKKVRGRYPSGSSVPYGSLAASAPDKIDTPDGDDIDDPAPRDMDTSTDSVHYRMREDGSEVVELPTSCSAPPVAVGRAVGAAGASVGPDRTSEGKLTESLYFVPKTPSGAVPGIPTATSINTDEPEPPSQGNYDVLPQQTARSPTPSVTSTSSTHTWSRISNKKLKVVTIVFATLLLSVFGIALCANYVWIPLHKLTQSHDVQHREGNVPILLQLSSFLVKKFRVVQEVDLKDSVHTVSVYLPNYGCDELPSTTTIQHYNASSPPPDIPIYMLEHSHISLHTCATTKENENNPVFFYITKTVEKSINFDGNQKKGRHAISVGIDNSFKYTTISSPITSSDYYSIRFSEVPSNVTLFYNLTVTIRKVDLDAVNATRVGTITPNGDDRTLERSIDFGTGEYCLLADIKDSAKQKTHNYTTLEAHREPRVGAAVAVTVGLLLVFILVVLLSGVLVVFYGKELLCYCHTKYKGYTSI